ncbi:MAG: Uncharacterized protein G01um101416_604 [Microgenomates group bacterium Gr01-1014_16]|nr:MAG: Uncharacterized protein G01um101416_604 [Microgenomates group bacterium Gr01-1014_16]
MSEEQYLQVKVRNRMGLVFEGQAVSVTSENKKGTFDVLGQHANFVTTVRKKLVITKPTGGKVVMSVDSGVMHVYKNVVLVFLGVM